MRNKDIAHQLKLLAKLLELTGENKFKIKAIATAAEAVASWPQPLSRMAAEEINAIKGIGKSTGSKVAEIISNGTLAELKELSAAIPEGIQELLAIKGLSVAKVKSIWHDLKITDLGELYKACENNELVNARGFGAKTQSDLMKLLDFRMASKGRTLWRRADDVYADLTNGVRDRENEWVATGAYRRLENTVDRLHILVTDASFEMLTAHPDFNFAEKGVNIYASNTTVGIPIIVEVVQSADLGTRLFETTGTQKHNTKVQERIKEATGGKGKTEADIYTAAGLPWIDPALREDDTWSIELAARKALPRLVTMTDLKGAMHNHSTFSDGANTVEEMAAFCREEMGLQYFGLSDHSKTAFYANGLSAERLLQQCGLIDQLNSGYNDFKIFKGIESDILGNGDLDYDDEVLKQLDFIVASIHSNLNMTRAKATERIVKAVENKYTTMLGHPSGRQLLVREGYDLDYNKVIDACAANGVIMEINANPLRLDLDWRWIHQALEKGITLSVNPDAHSTAELGYMAYGVNAARKGGVAVENCFNAWPLEKVSAYLQTRKP